MPWLLRWLRRLLDPTRSVSRSWLSDHERRSWGIGVEGVTWKWPVVKTGSFAAQSQRRGVTYGNHGSRN
jgi:hypothetical protein